MKRQEIQALETRTPQVSVIIPAYNQAKFLNDAIQSVLYQTYGDYEIIVVDDGSTDNTPLVAKGFGDHIRYIRQDNQGLGGARNTGIRNARGIYIAFLDSDDIWLPDFLKTIMQLLERNRESAVFYCGVRYVDVEGQELPQIAEGNLVSNDLFYETLVKANFIIPSTVVLPRSAILEAGLFDQATIEIHGCEDWDLWLRLAPTCHFRGIQECLVKYRLHGSSLSADPTKMQRAVSAVIKKHFGPDDGDQGKWPRIKHLAYGGVYRYHAWTSIMRQNNWETCTKYLRQALQVDPTTSKEVGFFYDLAMGSQPLGYRGTSQYLDLQSNAVHILQMLSEIFKSPTLSGVGYLRRETYGTACLTLGLVAYNTGQFSLCRKYLVRAIYYRPGLFHNSLVVGDLLKSLAGRSMKERIKKLKAQFSLRSANKVVSP